MFTRKFAMALGSIQLVILLATCGELDSGLSSSGTYRIDALTDKSSLEDCSVIRGSDQIQPYFISSVVNDPDIRGLTVFLQNPGGRPVSGRLQYILDPDTAVDDRRKDTAENSEEKPLPEETTELTPEIFGSGLPQENSQPMEVPHKDLIHLGMEDLQVPVSRIDMNLPSFILPKGLEIGWYVMVFQINGEREILDQIGISFYYVADVDFSLDDLKSYLPGPSAGSPIIPPGTSVILEVRGSADNQLEPYVVWYNGRKRISEGPMTGGVNQLIWKAPEQTGFHTIRAELFPFRPIPRTSGQVRELSLPVSLKHDKIGYFFENRETFSYWYRFNGDLQDSKALGLERALKPGRNVHPSWLPDSGIYGIALGGGDYYSLPGSPIILTDGKQGTGQFMFYFKPLGEGVIFTASFTTESPFQDVLNLTLSCTEASFNLELAGDSGLQRAAIYSKPFDNPEFAAVIIDFNILGTVLTASLRLENGGLSTEEISITLPGNITGSSVLQFGAPSVTAGSQREIISPWEDSSAQLATAILSEAALIYTVSSSLPKEAPPVEDAEEDTVEVIDEVIIEEIFLPDQAETPKSA